MEEKQEPGWGNRDWIWLTSILVIIIIILIANFYSGHKLLSVNFGIISSAVSIALAILAIALSLKQDSDNKFTNNQVNAILRGFSGDISSLKEHVIKLSPSEIKNAKLETVTETSVDSEKMFKKEEVEKKIEEALNIFQEKIVSNNLNSGKISYEERAFRIYRSNPNIIASELVEIMYAEYKYNISESLAKKWINNFEKRLGG